jgi:signal peptidase II
LGLILALFALGLDQGHKIWMLEVFDIQSRQPVAISPNLDLVLAWNKGISYSLLSSDTETGRWALFALSLSLILVLVVWLWRSGSFAMSSGLGLIIGGALGNAYDRYAHGAVADFFLLHIDTQSWGRLNWYIFNCADVAIVAGVLLLLYDSWMGPMGQAPQPEADPVKGTGDMP